ncbi:MAG: iron-containing redox enzyme family protein [Bdellovibrionales bacterium]|nr:iron-containing redox enzyme family protein [Bdellovibrionales bacterium]
MNNNNQTKNIKSLTYSELDKISDLVLNYPWENKDAYVGFISNMYYFLSQACRLLTAAASRCDLTYDQFHHRFVEHAHEEKNHEKLVTHDLKALGADLNPVLPSMPPIWQTQFYLIQNVSPLSLLGCVAYLENLSLVKEVGPLVYKRCLEVYGKKATSYLRVHVEEDGDHIDKLFTTLESLPEHEIKNVRESLLTTSTLYKNFFSELSDVYVGKKTGKAA